ncbi:MAG TPA: hypothetical protein VKZ97_01310 [Flavobacteriaceae bacterium]|nr:hypothetical protein [Flavobacteriaceae bacterium]
MKHLNIFLITLLLACTSTIKAQSFSSAVEYLDFIAEQQEDVTKNMWKYTKAIAHGKSDRSVNNKRNALLKTLEKAINNIKKAQGFDGTEYKGQVLDHMRLNESLLKHDYAKIIDMKEVAEQSYDLMEAYILAQEMADKKMEEAQLEYEINMHKFAAKHNVQLVETENDLSKKMKISNEVFGHYNAMYLAFFKVHINQIYLWDAMKSNDVSAIQQNSNALNQMAKASMETINSIETYKNDKSVIEATKKVFQFYIDETENTIPKITDFFLLNEDFETIKSTLDKTPQSKRTQEQIDAYNNKVKEFNKGIESYNKVNQNLNVASQRALDNLNKANENFLARHIPND